MSERINPLSRLAVVGSIALGNVLGGTMACKIGNPNSVEVEATGYSSANTATLHSSLRETLLNIYDLSGTANLNLPGIGKPDANAQLSLYLNGDYSGFGIKRDPNGEITIWYKDTVSGNTKKVVFNVGSSQ